MLRASALPRVPQRDSRRWPYRYVESHSRDLRRGASVLDGVAAGPGFLLLGLWSRCVGRWSSNGWFYCLWRGRGLLFVVWGMVILVMPVEMCVFYFGVCGFAEIVLRRERWLCLFTHGR